MTDAAPPLVSVVTPVHNGGRYLTECIDSVLAQTYGNFEYVIVNNASTDDTAAIAEGFAARDQRVRVVHTDSLLPIMENWNHAVRQIAADSVYCKVVHADDWLLPRCLEQMVALAATRPSIVMVGAYCQWRNEVGCVGLGRTRSVLSGREVCELTLKRRVYPFLSPSCLLIRSDRIRASEAFYDESLIYADVDMCYRLLADADFGFVHQVLTGIRWHDDSVTQTVDKPWNRSLVWNLDLLLRHGPVYLSPEVLHEQLQDHFRRHYRYLARACRDDRGADFWDYHSGELARLGHPLSRNRLRIARLVLLLNRIAGKLEHDSRWVG